MSLLIPDFGLLFWMTLSFGAVFFILAKFGFPAIVRMVEERKKYIDESLVAADEANRRLADIKEESAAIMREAQARQTELLHEAAKVKEQILTEAREAARQETAKMLDEARRRINLEKEASIVEIRSQAAILAVDIAEKILRTELGDKKGQVELANRLLDEIGKQQPES